MKLSTSINSRDIIGRANFFEKILEGFPVKKENYLKYISEWIKQNRIDGVELVISVNLKKDDIMQLKKILEESRIPVLSVHQPVLQIHKIDLESIRFLFEVASELSAKVIVVHLFALRDNIFRDEFVKELKSLERNYDIKVGLENSSKNFFTGIFTGSTRRYCWEDRGFSKILREKNFNITFDTTHMGQIKCNIVDFYSVNKDRIVNIHLSDCKNNLLGMHLPIGKGKLPIKDLLQLAKNYEYGGIITLEVNGKIGELLESIKVVGGFFHRAIAEQSQNRTRKK